MLIENLKLHYNLVKNEKYQTINRWVIIQSSKLFLKQLKIDEYVVLYPLDCINTQLDIDKVDSSILNPFIERLKNYKQINGQFGQQIYLLEVKLITINQDRMRVPGSGLNIQDILDDLLNILSLYYNRYFIIFPFNIFNDFNISEKYKNRIKNSDINHDDIDASSKDITINFNLLCQLRQEQFYLIEKSMKLYSNSLYANETNSSIALCFLISSIEILAQKYIELSEDWEEYSHLGFYHGLKKDLKKIEDEDLKQELFTKIGQRYIKTAFHIKARFKEFLFKFTNREFHLIEDSNDILFKELVSDYYDLRSLYIHAGTEILTPNYKRTIIYNRTDKGKLKTYQEGSKLDIRLLPSFQFLIIVIKSSVLNFLDHLYKNRDEEQDKQKYNLLDFKPRGTIEITAKRDILAGTAVSGAHVHMKEQYIHLYERHERIKEFDNTKNYKQLISEFTRIKEKIKDLQDFRRIALCNIFLGGYYLENEEIETAIPNLLEAKNLCEEMNLIDLEYTVNYNIACYYSLKNELEQAKEFLSKAIVDLQLKEQAKVDKHLDNLRNNSKFNDIFD